MHSFKYVVTQTKINQKYMIKDDDIKLEFVGSAYQLSIWRLQVPLE